jgi:hypothetical protein
MLPLGEGHPRSTTSILLKKKRGSMRGKKQAVAVPSEPKGSISTLYHSNQLATTTKNFQKMFDAVKPYEDQIHNLWGQHAQELGVFTGTRFEIGRLTSLSMKEVRDSRYPGGYKEYHKARNIAVPRQTCVRYAALYQDVASLNLKEEVLNAAFAAGIDLIKHVGKIKTTKTQVQQMDGPRFVEFLKQTNPPKRRPKPETVSDFVAVAMVTVADIFDHIKKDDEKNQAYAGVAYQISILSQKASFSAGEFTVMSPLAKDELEELFRVREV